MYFHIRSEGNDQFRVIHLKIQSNAVGRGDHKQSFQSDSQKISRDKCLKKICQNEGKAEIFSEVKWWQTVIFSGSLRASVFFVKMLKIKGETVKGSPFDRPQVDQTSALAGITAGLGTVGLTKQIGLNEAPVTRTRKTKWMTIGYYLVGGIVTSMVISDCQGMHYNGWATPSGVAQVQWFPRMGPIRACSLKRHRYGKGAK